MRMPKQRQKGGAVDVVEAWRQYYKHEGWHKIVPFDSRGRLGTPYALFKAKNVTDPVVRQEKWKKARPISPTFHHPMARLLHLAARSTEDISSARVSSSLGEHPTHGAWAAGRAGRVARGYDVLLSGRSRVTLGRKSPAGEAAPGPRRGPGRPGGAGRGADGGE